MRAATGPAEERLAALADPTRLRLCRLLAEGEMSVRQLVAALEVSQPLVSHHLKILRAAELVESRRESYWTFYRLLPERLEEVSGYLIALIDRARAIEPAGTSRSTYLSAVPAPRRWGMSETPEGLEEEAVGRAVDHLASEFVGVFSLNTVAAFFVDSLEHFAAFNEEGSALELTEAFARERLRAAARSAGTADPAVPEVLFVCVKNAGRSQIAAALLEHHAGGRIRGRSAGSTPARRIDLNVRAALDEIGVDLTSQFPKPLTDEFVRSADVVVTMGCGDACPVYEGKRYLDWDIADPAGRPLGDVRAIRDEIDTRVRDLIRELNESELAPAMRREPLPGGSSPERPGR